MFSKKPATAKAAWAVRLLTPDFLVDGYADSEAHPESRPFFTPDTGSTPAGTLWLETPRFTQLVTGAAAAPSVSRWLLPYNGHYAALLPFDNASLAAVTKNAQNHKYAFPAVLHVGPFAINGQLLSEYEAVDYLNTMANHACLAMREVEISYRLPGAQMAAFKAPLALVRTQLLQGIGLLG